jgi:hypothetical protein
MAFHNANFKIVNLPVGTYTAGDLGNNVTASTVHEVYCVSTGSITINALGGGTATFPMTAGQSVKVLVGSCTVASGVFVGFKTQWSVPGMAPIQWGGNS